MRCALGAQHGPNFGDDTIQCVQCDSAALAGRRADADKGEVAAVHGPAAIHGGAQVSFSRYHRDTFLQFRLNDRRDAFVDHRHFVAVDFNAYHLVSQFGEHVAVTAPT